VEFEHADGARRRKETGVFVHARQIEPEKRLGIADDFTATFPFGLAICEGILSTGGWETGRGGCRLLGRGRECGDDQVKEMHHKMHGRRMIKLDGGSRKRGKRKIA
jgi:hypothetical protein